MDGRRSESVSRIALRDDPEKTFFVVIHLLVPNASGYLVIAKSTNVS